MSDPTAFIFLSLPQMKGLHNDSYVDRVWVCHDLETC